MIKWLTRSRLGVTIAALILFPIFLTSLMVLQNWRRMSYFVAPLDENPKHSAATLVLAVSLATAIITGIGTLSTIASRKEKRARDVEK